MTRFALTVHERHWVFGLLLLGIGSRLFTLGSYPLPDTTEARYSEIGRKMAELGDWITPWRSRGPVDSASHHAEARSKVGRRGGCGAGFGYRRFGVHQVVARSHESPARVANVGCARQ